MRFGQEFRALVFVLTLLVIVSPYASANTDMDATGSPVAESGVEGEGGSTPPAPNEGDVPPADTGESDAPPVDEGEGDLPPAAPEGPPANDPDDGETPDAPDRDIPAGAEDDAEGVAPQEREDADDANAAAPASMPMQVEAADDVESQATDRTAAITVTVPGGGPAPDGTELCIWSSDEECQEWHGDPLVFTLYQLNSAYSVNPPAGSGFSYSVGVVVAPIGQSTQHTIELQPAASVTFTVVPDDPALYGTQICLATRDNWECATWDGEPLTLHGAPGAATYTVYPPTTSGYVEARGLPLPDLVAGETIAHTVTMASPRTLTVRIVTSDGSVPTEPVEVDIQPSTEWWQHWTGEDLEFEVSPGTLEWWVFPGGDYQSANGTFTVPAEGDAVLTIELEPAETVGELRVYVATRDGAAVPAGTNVCVSFWDEEAEDTVQECVVLAGSYASFTLAGDWVDITVTPPDGSGYLTEAYEASLEPGEISRVTVTLEAEATGAVTATVGTQDEAPLSEGDVGLCVSPGSVFSLFTCQQTYWATENEDGTLTFEFDEIPVGTYAYLVMNDGGYSPVQGTLTVNAGETTVVTIVLPVANEGPATIVIDIVTWDGAPVPALTEVCLLTIFTDEVQTCAMWTGEPVSFEVNPAIAVYTAVAPSGSGYSLGIGGPIVLEPGETVHDVVTLYPEDGSPRISMTVSDTSPESGDTVTYTIHALAISGYSQNPTVLAAEQHSFSFTIVDALPAELSDITVTCAGTYGEILPGTCYEIENGVLTVFGIGRGFLQMPLFDITVAVTGTIMGDPGTEVVNTACYAPTGGRGVPTEAEAPCASATLTIAAEEPVDPVDPEEPVHPVDPVDPVNPVDPAKPVDPSKPATPGTSQDQEAKVTGLPNTGDGAVGETSVALTVAIAGAIALAGAGLAMRVREDNAA